MLSTLKWTREQNSTTTPSSTTNMTSGAINYTTRANNCDY